MDLRAHVATLEGAVEELESAVEELDAASDHTLVRLLESLGVYPGTEDVVLWTGELSAAVDDLREAARGPHADLDDSVQATPEAADDWEERRLDVFRRDDWACRNCGNRGGAMGDAELHAHHVVPVAEGGRSRESNLVTLCVACHHRAHGGPE